MGGQRQGMADSRKAQVLYGDNDRRTKSLLDRGDVILLQSLRVVDASWNVFTELHHCGESHGRLAWPNFERPAQLKKASLHGRGRRAVQLIAVCRGVEGAGLRHDSCIVEVAKSAVARHVGSASDGRQIAWC